MTLNLSPDEPRPLRLTSTNRVVDVLLFGALAVVGVAGVAVVLYLLWVIDAAASHVFSAVLIDLVIYLGSYLVVMIVVGIVAIVAVGIRQLVWRTGQGSP